MAGGAKDKKTTGILIVGTASESRRALVEKAYAGQFELIYVSPDVDEKSIRSPDALQLTRRIAQAKMKSVLQLVDADEELVKKLSAASASFIITFDQVVTWGNEIREKPFNAAEAKKFLIDYSESAVSTVMTTVMVHYPSRREGYKQNTTRTYYGELNHKTIEAVLTRGKYASAAGAFTVEDPDLQQCMIRIDPGTQEEVQGFCIRVSNEMMTELSGEPKK